MLGFVEHTFLRVGVSKIVGSGMGLNGMFTLRTGEITYIPYFGRLHSFETVAGVNKWLGPKTIKNAERAYVIDTDNPLKKIDGCCGKEVSIAARANHVVEGRKASRGLANNAIFVSFTKEEIGLLTSQNLNTIYAYPFAEDFVDDPSILTCLEIKGPFRFGEEIFCDYNVGVKRRFGKNTVILAQSPVSKTQLRATARRCLKLSKAGLAAKKNTKAKKTLRMQTLLFHKCQKLCK